MFCKKKVKVETIILPVTNATFPVKMPVIVTLKTKVV